MDIFPLVTGPLPRRRAQPSWIKSESLTSRQKMVIFTKANHNAMTHRLLDIARPLFGSISICGFHLGDPESDRMLDDYAKNGVAKRDQNGNLIANLDIRHRSFMGALARVSFDENRKVERIVMVMSSGETDERLQTDISPLIDFIIAEGFFESEVDASSNSFLFRNALNEFSIQIYDQQIEMDLRYPNPSVTSHSPSYEEGALRTKELLESNTPDTWPAYLMRRRTEEARRLYGGASQQVHRRPEPESFHIDTLPDNAVLDGSAGALWLRFIETYNDKPRLLNILRQAQVYADNEQNNLYVKVLVQNDAQKNWLEIKVLADLIKGFSSVCRDRKVEFLIVIAE